MKPWYNKYMDEDLMKAGLTEVYGDDEPDDYVVEMKKDKKDTESVKTTKATEDEDDTTAGEID